MKKLSTLILSIVIISFPLFQSSASALKLATLVNDEGGKKVIVVDSTDSKFLFKLGYHLMTNKLGATIYQTPPLFETSLATAISSTATSATMVLGTTRDGQALNGNYCFTIDSGLNTAEYICGVASSTSLTALQRGIGADGVSSYVSLKFPHRYGSNVKITDFPALQQMGRMLSGLDSLPGGLRFGTNSLDMGANGVITNMATPLSSATSSVANIDYVNKSTVAGAVAGAENVPGIWEGATRAEMSAGTATSSYSATDYNLVLQSKYASSTSSATSTVVVSKSDGKIDTSYIDTSYNNSWTGTNSFSNTTTMATTTISNALISSVGLNVDSIATTTGIVHLNTSSKTRLILMSVTLGAANGGVDLSLTVSTGASSTALTTIAVAERNGMSGATGSGSNIIPITFIVRPGEYYKFTVVGTPVSIGTWYECDLY